MRSKEHFCMRHGYPLQSAMPERDQTRALGY